MNFDVNAVNTVDQDTVERPTVSFPLIMFRKGAPAQRKAGGVSYEGGWFIADDKGGSALAADLEANGWIRDSFISESEEGGEIEGYWNKQITVSIVLDRHKWIETDTGGYSKEQYLVFVKGLEDKGLFQLTFSGHTAMAFKGVKTYFKSGVLSSFDRTVIAAANALTKPKVWPRRAFWLTVGASTDAKGQPLFTSVGKGDKTTPIVLPVPIGLPEKANIDKETLGKFFVGTEFLKIANDAYTDNESWKEWPTNEDESVDHASDNGPTVKENELSELGI